MSNSLNDNNVMQPISKPASVSKSSSYKVRRRFSLHISNTYGLSVFHYVFMILFIISFYYAVIGRDFSISFSGLLSILENAPSIPTDWITTISDLSINSDWGLFNFLKEFINIFTGILSFLLYIVTGAVQLIIYLGYFIKMFFGY